MQRELLKDLIYGEQIKTQGCQVNFMVGLTYSLDLEAMLTIPLAIADIGELDSSVKKNPTYILTGIHKASNKIAIFCNKGKIHVPKQQNVIYPLLESSIFEVVNKDNIFSNFHPKLWLVHETDKNGIEWLKLSVLTRNIDLSTCIDTCCSIRGRIFKRRSLKGSERHAPLKDMLLWLSNNFAKTDKTRKDKIIEVANLLDYVESFSLCEPFKEDAGYNFFPFVFGKEEFSKYRQSFDNLILAERILIVSPFIEFNQLEWLTKRKKPYLNRKSSILITRREYVTEKVFNLFDEVYVPNDVMIDNTTTNMDLHAKMYLVQNAKEDLGYSLFLGSSNATPNAFYKNSEFLLRLCFKQTTIDRIEELKNEIIQDNRFIKVDIPDEEAQDKPIISDNEKRLKKSSMCFKKALIKESEKQGLYNITLSLVGDYDKEIKVRPLQCPSYWQPIGKEIIFTQLEPYMLSELFVLSIPQDDKNQSLEMVIKVHAIGMPKNRDENIYQSIVSNKKELIDFVAFMLSDTPIEYIFEHNNLNQESKNINSFSQDFFAMPLYEELLKKAYTNPSQIDEVIDFVSKMNKEIVPKELSQILNTFKQAIKLQKKK